MYCGSKYWRPLKWLGDGEFCCPEHRDLYQGRLRKIAVHLTDDQSLPEPLLESEDPDVRPAPVPEAKPEPAPPRLAAFAPVVKDFSIAAPLEHSRAITDSLPAAFETQARIKRWGLRMRFRHQAGR